MSRLIFKGDTIKNFGEFFPAIFVEQVTVEDNSLLVQLALHVVINEDREVVDVLTELGDLSFYLMAVTDEDKISNIISRETNVFEVLFDLDLYDMDADTYSTLEATLTSPQVEEIKANLGEHEQLIIGEFEIAADDLYDDNGNKILRLTTEVAFTQMAEFGWDFFENISLFAFSSIINFSDSTSTEIDDKLEILPLLDNNISDIVYENVFKDGEIAGIQEVKWMDSSDAIFDAVPLQTIDAKYRKINQITHKDITDSFEQLLENSEQLAETNPTIKNAANSISNILTVYGSAADLIPRLNELRKAFPSKSSVTPLGRMYSQFKNKLMAANKSAMQGDTLNKRVVSNPVVVDNRQALSLEWSASDIDEVLLGSDYLYNKWYVDSQSIVKSGDTYAGYVSTGGFYFFDLEKYIHNASNLATIFNISKLEKLFGSGFVNSGFRISESYIERYSITDGSVATSPSVKITSTIGRNPVTTYIEISKTEGEAYAKIETEDDTEHSYLYIRNFGLANDETDTYRLAMFEFQDLYPESIVDTFEEPPSSYMYAGNVTISDVSENIAIAVTGSYYKYLAQVEKYKDIASEHCSYNNIDNHFNDFFVDNMVAAYSDDMENAPWIRGPIVYNIHRDLLFDEFGGDIDEILEASKKISDRIGPQAGTLERIEAFFNRYEALYDNHYTDTTDIADAVKDFQDSDGERSFGNWFSDIPLVYDNTLAEELAAEAAAFADEQRSERQAEALAALAEDAEVVSAELLTFGQALWDACIYNIKTKMQAHDGNVFTKKMLKKAGYSSSDQDESGFEEDFINAAFAKWNIRYSKRLQSKDTKGSIFYFLDQNIAGLSSLPDWEYDSDFGELYWKMLLQKYVCATMSLLYLWSYITSDSGATTQGIATDDLSETVSGEWNWTDQIESLLGSGYVAENFEWLDWENNEGISFLYNKSPYMAFGANSGESINDFSATAYSAIESAFAGILADIESARSAGVFPRPETEVLFETEDTE